MPPTKSSIPTTTPGFALGEITGILTGLTLYYFHGTKEGQQNLQSFMQIKNQVERSLLQIQEPGIPQFFPVLRTNPVEIKSQPSASTISTPTRNSLIDQLANSFRLLKDRLNFNILDTRPLKQEIPTKTPLKTKRFFRKPSSQN